MRLPTQRIDKWESASLPVLNDIIAKIQRMFISKIEFNDNIYCDLITFTSSGGVGTAHTVSHELNKIPTGFFVYSTISGTAYMSGAPAWTSTAITFTQCFSGQTAGGAPGIGDEVNILVF